MLGLGVGGYRLGLAWRQWRVLGREQEGGVQVVWMHGLEWGQAEQAVEMVWACSRLDFHGNICGLSWGELED